MMVVMMSGKINAPGFRSQRSGNLPLQIINVSVTRAAAKKKKKKTARAILTMKTRSKPLPLRFPSNGAHDCPLDAPVHALILR